MTTFATTTFCMPLCAIEGMRSRGEITARDYRRYLFAWGWSAHRFSGIYALRQELYLAHRGKHAYYRRINRVRKVLNLTTI